MRSFVLMWAGLVVAATGCDCSGSDRGCDFPVDCVRECGGEVEFACGVCPTGSFHRGLCGRDGGSRDAGGDPMDGGERDAGVAADTGAGDADTGAGEVDSGPDAGVRECEVTPCFRAYECAAACGEAPFYVGCCPCPPGSVDLPVDCGPDAGPGGTLPEGAVCTTDRAACGPGLSCCYPCGIPDCDWRCEPTCAPGTPDCFDGCYSRA